MDKIKLKNHKKTKSQIIDNLLTYLSKNIEVNDIIVKPDSRDLLINRLKNKIQYLEKELEILNKVLIE